MLCSVVAGLLVKSELVRRPKRDFRLCDAVVDDGVLARNGSPVSARASDDAPGLLRAAISAGLTSCGIAGGAWRRGVGATLGVGSSMIEGRRELDAGSLDSARAF
jgi:hypothetical protein